MHAHAARRLATALGPVLLGAAALAGGSEEKAVLVVDPANPVSLHVANHYRAARGLPARNVLYFAPGAPDYPTFVGVNLVAFEGELLNRGIGDHVDFVVLPPGGSFYVPAPGLISDGCFPVSRIAIASGYTLAHQSQDILGHEPSTTPNHYAPPGGWVARAFDGRTTWLAGAPSEEPGAQRYYVAAMLGYTGERGNTLAEVLALIDRSVAADATHPAGTFYFMQTNDVARSSPRHGAYPGASSQINGLGGAGQHLFADLPLGNHDCLGIMTGLAAPDVDGADLTLLPGSFADHLTSFAGRFDTASQTKMSRWIAKGASGTAGTVEEPCNYAGKFPHARFHVVYFKGLCLGEAWFRSHGFAPYQSLLYGDPLTRPFAWPPTVDVPDAPQAPVSGIVALTPSAAATEAGASLAGLDLYVDGRLVGSVAPGQAFALDTTELADGWHELRVQAYDDQLERNTGRWIGSLEAANLGRSVTLTAGPAAGDLTQRFDFTYAASGGTLAEARLVQNGRVLAASTQAAGTLSVHGRILGAGPVEVQAEALFDDGTRAVSAPVALAVLDGEGTPAGQPPVAYGYTKTVYDAAPFVVELPATYDDALASAVYTLVTPPAQAGLVGTQTGPWRVFQPDPGAAGTDQLDFRVDTPSGSSQVVQIRLEYRVLVPPPGAPLCFGDGSGAPCPCGNESPTPGEGCLHSGGRGMTISGTGSGSVAADDLLLSAEGCPILNTGLFYCGLTSLAPGQPLYDGLQCAAGPARRFRSLFQLTGFVTDTDFVAQDPSGTFFVPGLTYVFQYWGRDASAPGPCGTGANFSPGYAVTATP